MNWSHWSEHQTRRSWKRACHRQALFQQTQDYDGKMVASEIAEEFRLKRLALQLQSRQQHSLRLFQ